MSYVPMNAALPGPESSPTSQRNLADTVALHSRLRDQFSAEADRLEQRGNRLSLARLGTFLACVVFTAAAWPEKTLWLFGLAVASLLVFFGLVVAHGKVISAQQRAFCRRDIHVRHLARLGVGWHRFANKGDGLLPREHAYAFDIDLIGQGSLFQRIDVTHTKDGERLLAEWLGAAADGDTTRARQEAVSELRDQVEWRQELEAAGIHDQKLEKLDPSRLAALAQIPRLFEQKPWLLPVSRILPVFTLSAIAAGSFGLVHERLWVLFVAVQFALKWSIGKTVGQTLDILEAKTPVLEAYKELLLLLERARFQSPLLVSLQKRVSFGQVPPSAHLARLSFWVNLAELRHNLLHVVIDPITLWDLHVLYGVEKFMREAGGRTSEWFQAVGELEALASLATLAHGDPSAIMPELSDERAPLEATGIAHPLLLPNARVANDLHLRGPGTALVVTGSNMAGKSTLLRSVGQNIALALAGGPVIAESMRVPRVRLRASMRADDSLEGGSSYFHAELSKLKRVIDSADASPPVFFLLDELLRGTNARARHVGAKAVLVHLLERGSTGLCATHDVELAALGNTDAAHIENVHFTDVLKNGEMIFDYRLRPGIVRTSNALRLLAMAGVDVPSEERALLESGNTRLDETPDKHEALE